MSDADIARLERDLLAGGADAATVRALASYARANAVPPPEGTGVVVVPTRHDAARIESYQARTMCNWAVAFTPDGKDRKMMFTGTDKGSGFALDILQRSSDGGARGTHAVRALRIEGFATADGQLRLKVEGHPAMETKR